MLSFLCPPMSARSIHNGTRYILWLDRLSLYYTIVLYTGNSIYYFAKLLLCAYPVKNTFNEKDIENTKAHNNNCNLLMDNNLTNLLLW
jgi:hypothetical protein